MNKQLQTRLLDESQPPNFGPSQFLLVIACCLLKLLRVVTNQSIDAAIS
jgi:hypothetical protein